LAISSVSAINLPDNIRSPVSSQLNRTAALRDEGKNLRKIAGAFVPRPTGKPWSAVTVLRARRRAMGKK
jgi:hypothetical protein